MEVLCYPGDPAPTPTSLLAVFCISSDYRGPAQCLGLTGATRVTGEQERLGQDNYQIKTRP